MSLQGLRTQSFATACLIVFGSGLTACGPQFSSERAAIKEAGTLTQSYQEWCTDWQLNCPAADPGKTDPLTLDQYKALTTILGSALQSPSVINLNRQDLDAPGLKQAISTLHLDDVYQDVHARLDANQWQSLALEGGSLVSRNAVVSSVRTEAGILLQLDTLEKVSVAPGSIGLSGIGLGADAVETAPALQTIAAGADGTFSFGLNDRTVNQVPQSFALDNLLLAFGLDTGKLENRTITLQEIVAAAGPLIGALNQGNRQIALDRGFFTSTAPQLGVLLPADAIGQNLGNLLNLFDKVRTSTDPKANLATVNLLKNTSGKCDLNKGEVKLKFATEFGVKRWYQPNPTTLGLEFYGLEASAKKALGISIKLKRVELGADKITILDVPIIGKVDLKWDDIGGDSGQKTSLICGT